MSYPKSPKKVALALGSGSARGMAHIGVIQRLKELDIEPDIVCGSSIGALVGACHLIGKLDDFAEWTQKLSTAQIFHYMGVSLAATGGMAHATRLIGYFVESYGNPDIESLDKPFAAVATDLYRGREVWLQRGPLWGAVRASIAIPGVLTPVAHSDDEAWLVDGGLVNPVPVSVCRALGAEIIIGVDLNSDILGRRRVLTEETAPDFDDVVEEEDVAEVLNPEEAAELSAFSRFANSVKEVAANLRSEDGAKPTAPGTLSVMMSAINIMQDRITRSRLAGEPADILICPRLGHIGLLEFSRASEAIAEGREAVDRMLPALRYTFEREGDMRLSRQAPE